MRNLLICIYLCFAMNAAWASDYVQINALAGPVQFEPSGKYWAQVNENQLQLWSIKERKLKHRLQMPSPITQYAFTPDGLWLAVADRKGEIRIWDTQHYKQIQKLQPEHPFQSFALSPDGIYLTLARLSPREEGRLALMLYDYDLRRPQRAHVQHVLDIDNSLPGHTPNVNMAYHPLNQYLAVGIEAAKDHWLLVKDEFSGQWIYWMPGSPPLAYSLNGAYFSFLVPSPQGTWKAKLWHTPTDLLKTLPLDVAPPPVSAVCLSPKATYLAVTTPVLGRQREVHIFRVRDLSLVSQFKVPQEVDTLSFSVNETQLLMSSFVAPEFHPLLYRLP